VVAGVESRASCLISRYSTTPPAQAQEFYKVQSLVSYPFLEVKVELKVPSHHLVFLVTSPILRLSRKLHHKSSYYHNVRCDQRRLVMDNHRQSGHSRELGARTVTKNIYIYIYIYIYIHINMDVS
jgi:hypothetical protein